jgi:hypothetical protein
MLTAGDFCAVKTEYTQLKRLKPLKNPLSHSGLFELVTSMLIR